MTRAELEATIAKVRRAVPGVAIRTSVMVGFPGETEADFAELLDFVAGQKFDHLGCFAYSQEEGTVAGRMQDQISEPVKAHRLDRVMTLQRQISSELLRARVGETVAVLVDGVARDGSGQLQGRLATQAPEVDGVVYLEGSVAQPGSIQMAKIRSALAYDLVGLLAGVLN